MVKPQEALTAEIDVVGSYRRALTRFTEAIEKERLPPGTDPVHQAFTHLVTRFERFLRRRREREWPGRDGLRG